MKASKAIAGFAGQVQNQLTLSLMRARKPTYLASVRAEQPAADTSPMVTLLAGLAIAIAVLGIVSSQTGQSYGLTMLSVLAAAGLFFILAVALGRVSFAGSSSAAAQETIADAWPDAVMVTTRLGAPIYANAALDRLLVPHGQGLAALEAWCARAPEAREALFRLVRAGERGEPRIEEIDIKAEDLSPRQGLRINVTPLEAAPRKAGPLVLWRIADITAERETAKFKASAAESGASAYNRAPAGLFALGADGTVAHMNLALRRLLGLPAEPDGDDPVGLDAIFAAPGCEVLARHLAQPSMGVFQCALDLVARNGNRIGVRVLGAGLTRGADDSFEDRILIVTRNDWTQLAMAGVEVTDPGFARHFEQAPFGIATMTAEGRIARANPAFSQMVFDGTGGLDQHALDVVCRDTPADARAAVGLVLAEALAGHAGVAPVDFAAGAKGEYGRRIYVTPLVQAGSSREAAIVYVVDTTEQKALEARFTQSQKMEAVGQLVGGIAHNFNNVLTAIIGSADLLLQTHRASDAAHKDIQNIKQSANRAAELVGNLMAFSRQQTLRLEVLHLGEAMTDMRPMLKTSLGEKIDLRISSDRDLWVVKADRSQIHQALLNFARNAQHAMPDGGVFSVATRNISERDAQRLDQQGMQAAEYVLIEVSDTGTGIAPDVIEKIFEPYFTTKEVGKGTGFGLSSVYGFVKQSSGYIYVDSELGQGTTFRIYLPRVHVDEAVLAAASIVKTRATPADLTGTATVLIVEDEDMVRSVAVRSLKRLGYIVLEAGNGVEALDVLAGHGGAVDLVVSDVVMPEMDGPTFFKEVRKTNSGLKFIFVSGHTNEAFKESMDQNEQLAFLQKPFSLPQLAAKVKEELRR